MQPTSEICILNEVHTKLAATVRVTAHQASETDAWCATPALRPARASSQIFAARPLLVIVAGQAGMHTTTRKAWSFLVQDSKERKKNSDNTMSVRQVISYIFQLMQLPFFFFCLEWQTTIYMMSKKQKSGRWMMENRHESEKQRRC